MAEQERTSAQIIVEEIRRQVDLQVKAADALDTKAMAIFAGTGAVAAFISPRVTVAGNGQAAAAIVTFALLIGALLCLLLAVRPRIAGFSNGPDVADLAAYVNAPPNELEAALVPSFVKVRNINENVLKSKGDWIVWALRSLIGAVAGMAAMVVTGALK
ncbi:MAG: hypothetical protein ACLQHS_08400 [Candidatus Limnocylindrales bacterium]